MPNIQKTASLHEKTVQKLAEDLVVITRNTRGKDKRPRNGRVEVKHWWDGVDPLLVAYVRTNKIYYRCVEVVSPTEIIIHEGRQS